MHKRDLYPSSDPLGVEAGFYIPVPTLGDAALPPPRSLRLAVLAVLAVLLAAIVLVVYTVPVVTHTWQVVSHQTDKVLGRILGRAEQQTAEFLGGVGLTGSTAIETEAVPPQIH
ncbi:hypothetical protein GCM10023144_15480 [Pigmentiphaga soli]|uniref:Uncharacterized protein n=1 Tax=Pigmentiphaga soli TaxID=1007095 RepID=A0ABP8GS04_9BURK